MAALQRAPLISSDARARLSSSATSSSTASSTKAPWAVVRGGGDGLVPGVSGAARLLLQQIGVNEDTQVVVYDRNGMNYCGRLWWMLKWCGHEAVAVLDGGLQAWVAEGGAVRAGAVAEVDHIQLVYPGFLRCGADYLNIDGSRASLD